MVIRSGQKSLPTIGFLTVIRDAEQALYGGYLVLNAVGRPLEFHCTAPVRPNRAQQILYGPSLEPYLCGDRIGQTLFSASKRAPTLAITDSVAVMAARQLIAHPLVLYLGRCEPGEPSVPHGSTARADGQGSSAAAVGSVQPADCAVSCPAPRSAAEPLEREDQGGFERFELGPYQLAAVAEHAADRQTWAQHWQLLTDQIDLEEPFQRIREAIDEARRGAH
jgi:hypothetical protein